MSQFPVATEEGLYEGINYLLSGPSGLGQDFKGFSAYAPDYYNEPEVEPTYLTGNFRSPFSQSGQAKLYVAPIALSNAEQLDDRTIKYTFAAAEASPPFSLGNGLAVTDVVPNSFNSATLKANGNSINQVGVIECTTTYVIVRTVRAILSPLGTYTSGGNISYFITANYNDSNYTSTDCNARVTVSGGTDRVFISGQLSQALVYDVLSGPSNFRVWVAINRYIGQTNNDPVNPDYIFEKDATVARKIYTYTDITGINPLEIETIFSTVVDQPPPGYYWYILEVIFEYAVDGGVKVQVLSDRLGLRSLSAQVVKQ